jgi:riboflavin synthase
MFTGIVQAVGEIVRAQPFEVDCGRWICATSTPVTPSACKACALPSPRSVPRVHSRCFSRHPRVTAGLDREGPVNLEKALALGERLGGHLVAGHVDGVGEVTRFQAGALEVRAPRSSRATSRARAPSASTV